MCRACKSHDCPPGIASPGDPHRSPAPSSPCQSSTAALQCREGSTGNKASWLAAALIFLTVMGTGVIADAAPNYCGKWALHFAGPHDSKNNTCDFSVDSYYDVVVNAPVEPGSYDIYILALDVVDVAGTRFGLYGDGLFYFYSVGWQNCAYLEIPTPGWPGCGESVSMTWPEEQHGWSLVLGIINIYVYGGGRIWTGPDPTVGYAEWCDGTEPEPRCDRFQYNSIVGCSPWGIVDFSEGYGGCCPMPHYEGAGCYTPGFDLELYGDCSTTVGSERSSWGAIKALYR